MATLLSLPRELRDEILRLALHNVRPAPESPAASLDRVELRHEEYGDDFDEEQTCVFVERERPVVFPSLLLVNKQIHAEVLPLIEQHDANLVLDIMYVHCCGWWPTWLCSPYLQRAHFSTLYVQIRIFRPGGQGIPDSWGHDVFFWRLDFQNSTRLISPAAVTTSFHQLLFAFLRHGPQFGWKLAEDIEGRYSVQNLILDVLPPENAEHHLILGYMHGSHTIWDFFLQHRFVGLEPWPRQWPKPEKINPEYLPAEKLACFIWTWLRMVLIFRAPLEESDIFYGGVGALEVRVNGEQRRTADLSLWLERLYREQWDLESRRTVDQTKIRDTVHELRKVRRLAGGSVAYSCGDEGDDDLEDIQDDYADYHRWADRHTLDMWSIENGDDEVVLYYR